MEIYHVLNRGVEKRDIVKNNDDRMRFVRGLYLFNDRNNAPNAISQKGITLDSAPKRELLVKIHAWCLMNNHYHLLLSPVDDDLANISLFMKKVNMGYAKFFNEKYDRSGYLWQGRYKKILIETDAHFNYIPYYIHLNPLDRLHKQWRVGGVTDCTEALGVLDTYRWSSYLDYQGTKNFPSVLHTQFLKQILGTAKQQSHTMKSIISDSSFNNTSEKFET